MHVLFIGGTGNISTACTHRALEKNIEVFHLNRGSAPEKAPSGVVTIRADIRNSDEARRAVAGLRFQSVVQFVGYLPQQIEADLALFRGRTEQYILISTASAYRKPPPQPVITESMSLWNPFWEYSRQKIACERVLEKAWQEEGFPFTVVRPSHTYDNGRIPTVLGGRDYTVAQRILDGKDIVVHGDGQSLWTLTHSSDFAKGLVGLLGNPAAIGEAFHITSDESLTWDSIHEIIGRVLGVAPRIVHVTSEFIAKICPERGAGLLGDKTHSVIFDNSKIKRTVPEFHATITFLEGMRRCIEWFDAQPKAKVVDPAVNADYELVLTAWRKALGAAG